MYYAIHEQITQATPRNLPISSLPPSLLPRPRLSIRDISGRDVGTASPISENHISEQLSLKACSVIPGELRWHRVKSNEEATTGS